MTNEVTCTVHGGPVEQQNAMEMPNGWICDDCYRWMEDLMEEDDE